jgi:hypothetical protein
MKAMALKIIGGRKFGGDLQCLHFAYQLVRSIVPKDKLAQLSHLENWPENMRVMNKHFLDNEGTNPFEICKNFV